MAVKSPRSVIIRKKAVERLRGALHNISSVIGALADLDTGSGDASAVADDVGGMVKHTEVGQRIAVVNDEVGRCAIVEAWQAQETSRGPAGRPEGDVGRQAGRRQVAD